MFAIDGLLGLRYWLQCVRANGIGIILHFYKNMPSLLIYNCCNTESKRLRTYIYILREILMW